MSDDKFQTNIQQLRALRALLSTPEGAQKLNDLLAAGARFEILQPAAVAPPLEAVDQAKRIKELEEKLGSAKLREEALQREIAVMRTNAIALQNNVKNLEEQKRALYVELADEKAKVRP